VERSLEATHAIFHVVFAQVLADSTGDELQGTVNLDPLTQAAVQLGHVEGPHLAVAVRPRARQRGIRHEEVGTSRHQGGSTLGRRQTAIVICSWAVTNKRSE